MDEEAELVILNMSGDAPLGREFQAAKAVLAERGKVPLWQPPRGTC